MKRNNQTLDSVFPEVSELFHDRAMAVIDSQFPAATKHTQTNERVVIMRFKALIIAAAVTLVGTISVGAYSLLSGRNTDNSFNPKMAEILNVDEEMQERLTNDGMSKAVNLSATDNGVTMDVLQTIADENMVYILLKFSSENKTLLECENFDNVWEAIKIEGYLSYYELADFDKRIELLPENVFTGSLSPNMIYDSRETVIDENGKEIHQVYYAISIHNNDKQDFNGREITLSFKDFGACMSKAADFEVLIKGTWEVSWVLEYADHTRLYELNQVVDVNGVGVLVKSVEISPLALNVVIDGDSANALQKFASANLDLFYEARDDYGNTELFEEKLLHLFSFMPVLDDGELFDSLGGMLLSGGTDDWLSKKTFGEVLDLDRVVAIRAICTTYPEYNFEIVLK